MADKRYKSGDYICITATAQQLENIMCMWPTTAKHVLQESINNNLRVSVHRRDMIYFKDRNYNTYWVYTEYVRPLRIQLLLFPYLED